MKVTRENNKSGTVLSVDGDLTIYTVAQAKQVLLEDYENFSSPVALELQSVTEIDTAGLQLLLFMHKLLSGINKNVYVTKSNEQVDSILQNMDVATYFTLEN